MKSFKTLLALAATALISTFSASAGEAELDGYCPVCYISAGKAVKGSKEFAAKHNDKTYYFVHADAMKAFQAEPTKFLPQYDGHCAYGISLNKKFDGNPKLFSVVGGKLYLNGNKDAHKAFSKDKKGVISKANGNWKAIAMAAEKEKMKK